MRRASVCFGTALWIKLLRRERIIRSQAQHATVLRQPLSSTHEKLRSRRLRALSLRIRTVVDRRTRRTSERRGNSSNAAKRRCMVIVFRCAQTFFHSRSRRRRSRTCADSTQTCVDVTCYVRRRWNSERDLDGEDWPDTTDGLDTLTQRTERRQSRLCIKGTHLDLAC